jgi:hypothetical protein
MPTIDGLEAKLLASADQPEMILSLHRPWALA